MKLSATPMDFEPPRPPTATFNRFGLAISGTSLDATLILGIHSAQIGNVITAIVALSILILILFGVRTRTIALSVMIQAHRTHRLAAALTWLAVRREDHFFIEI
jgi:hypothetical protein